MINTFILNNRSGRKKIQFIKFLRNTKINKRFELFHNFSQLTKLRDELKSIKSAAFVLRRPDRDKTVSEL